MLMGTENRFSVAKCCCSVALECECSGLDNDSLTVELDGVTSTFYTTSPIALNGTYVIGNRQGTGSYFDCDGNTTFLAKCHWYDTFTVQETGVLGTYDVDFFIWAISESDGWRAGVQICGDGQWSNWSISLSEGYDCETARSLTLDDEYWSTYDFSSASLDITPAAA